MIPSRVREAVVNTISKKSKRITTNHLTTIDTEDGVMYDEDKDETRTAFAAVLYRTIGGA